MVHTHKRMFLILLVGAEMAAIGYLLVQLAQASRARVFLPQAMNLYRLEKSEFALNPESAVDGMYEPVSSRVNVQAAEWYHPEIHNSYNADGLHDRYEYPVEKAPGVRRIITLGDSFAFGMFVNTAENFSERLEDMLNLNPVCAAKQYEVLNLGVPGYDIEFSAERYRLRGSKYKPDLIVWYILANDFTERAALVSQSLPEIVSDVLQAGYQGYDLIKISSKRMEEELAARYGGIEAIMRYQSDVLTGFLQSVAGTPVLLMLDSRMEETERDRIATLTAPYAHVRVMQLPSNDTLLDSHPSALGHQQIAGALYRLMGEQPEIYCRQD